MKKSNFPPNKTIVCSEKHTPDQHKEIMKMCIDYDVPVWHESWVYDINWPFIEFDGEHISCRNNDNHYHTSVSLSEFKAFIRGEGKLPVEFKTGWYKHKNNRYPEWKMYFNFEKKTGYGIGAGSIWVHDYKNYDSYIQESCEPATTEEVTEALKKEALKRGYTGKYINIIGTKRKSKNIIGDIFWIDEDGDFVVNSKGCSYTLMRGGFLVEIIEQPKKMTVDEIALELANKLTFTEIMCNYLESTTKEKLEEILGYKIEIIS